VQLAVGAAAVAVVVTVAARALVVVAEVVVLAPAEGEGGKAVGMVSEEEGTLAMVMVEGERVRREED